MNTVMASGDVPDYLLLSRANKAMLTQSARDGLPKPLDDLIPKTKALKSEQPDEVWDLFRIEGEIVGVPMMRHDPTPHLIGVRGWWLKNVNTELKSIKTVDDEYKLYVSSRDRDPDGNGKQNQWGLLIRTDSAPSMAAASRSGTGGWCRTAFGPAARAGWHGWASCTKKA